MSKHVPRIVIDLYGDKWRLKKYNPKVHESCTYESTEPDIKDRAEITLSPEVVERTFTRSGRKELDAWMKRKADKRLNLVKNAVAEALGLK